MKGISGESIQCCIVQCVANTAAVLETWRESSNELPLRLVRGAAWQDCCWVGQAKQYSHSVEISAPGYTLVAGSVWAIAGVQQQQQQQHLVHMLTEQLDPTATSTCWVSRVNGIL